MSDQLSPFYYMDNGLFLYTLPIPMIITQRDSNIIYILNLF